MTRKFGELKEKCHELTGKWIPYHWDCFKDLDDYKEHMKNYTEHDTTGPMAGGILYILKKEENFNNAHHSRWLEKRMRRSFQTRERAIGILQEKRI